MTAPDRCFCEGLYADWSESKTVIDLHRLDVESEYRWQGRATRFMRSLCAYADYKGLPIELEVGSGTDDENIIEDLPAWYSTFGFEWQDGYMRREPEKTDDNNIEQKCLD